MSNDREQAFRKALEPNIPPTTTHVMNINWLAVGFQLKLQGIEWGDPAGDAPVENDASGGLSSMRRVLAEATHLGILELDYARNQVRYCA